MKFEIEHTFDDYIRMGNQTSEEVLASQSSLVDAIRHFDTFFRTELWSGNIEMLPSQAFLSMNAYMVYLSAIRTVLTGHIAAAYPLFITSLESACYAFLVGQDPTLDDVWNHRHDSEESLRESRRRFSAAVTDTAKLIDKSQGDQGHGQWINECYQSAIDFGAHPNPKSIYNHLRLPEDREEFYVFGLIGLHNQDSFEMARGLMACLDYGLVNAVVLANSIRQPTQQLSEALFRINALKEPMTTEHFPDVAASL